MRRIGSRAISWLVAAAVTAMLSPVSMSFAAQNGPDTINSAAIIAADGISGQTLTTGSGVKTSHIQDGAVTASKLGIVCANGEYLQYVFGSGWVCSVGTAGPAGPQGPTGETGIQGPAGPTPHYANVIVVAKSGGDFIEIQIALDSITDASNSNPYLIKVMPGVYSATATINMKPYVDIEGAGVGITKITGSNAFLKGASNAELRNLTIENVGGTGIWNISTENTRFSNVNIIVTSGTGGAIGIYNWAADIKLDNVTMSVTSDSNSIYGIYSVNHSKVAINNLTMKISPLISSVSWLYNYGIYSVWSDVEINNSSILFSDVNASSTGLSTQVGTMKIKNSQVTAQMAIYNDDTASTVMNNSEINGQIYGPVKCFSSFNANYDTVCQ